ncbi:Transcription factor E [uncultured archaeon]|nr:Transcription factor E [uncultured archaeon]
MATGAKQRGKNKRASHAAPKMGKARRAAPHVPRIKSVQKAAKPARGPSKLHAPAQKAKPSSNHAHGHNHLWKSTLLQDADVRRWLIRSVGEHAIHVISDFNTPMSDEQIAQKSGIRASDVRVVLNKLHSYGLATYLRNRDKNSGWYSYVWKLNNEHAQGLKERVQAEEEQTVVAEVPMGEGEHYSCQSCTGRCFDFEQVSTLMFKCDQCGQDLRFLEPQKKE